MRVWVRVVPTVAVEPSGRVTMVTRDIQGFLS